MQGNTNNSSVGDVYTAILGLMTAYVHSIDDDRLEEWPDFFTDNGSYRVTTRENIDLGLPVSLIFCDGKGMLSDRISALRKANIFEPQVYCHTLGLPEIVKSTNEHHSVRTNFSIIRTMQEGDMSVFACGRYFDRIVEDNDVLRFQERIVVLDSRRVDTLLVIPL